jgi:hypothetical protein
MPPASVTGRAEAEQRAQQPSLLAANGSTAAADRDDGDHLTVL